MKTALLTHARRHLLALCATLLFGGAAWAQPQSTEHLLLGSPYGEFCTMCEAFVLCTGEETDPAPESLPTGGQYSLYYFPTRTFWQQVATIWEWFRAMFVPMNTHSRPLEIYQSTVDGLAHRVTQTTFSIDPARIIVPSGFIDRDNGRWLDNEQRALGQCYRLPLWQTLDELKTITIYTQPRAEGAAQ